MSRLRRYDCLGGIFWFLVGLALSYGSIGLRLGSLQRPGAGFMPFVSGIALSLFGIGLVISASRDGKQKEEEGERAFNPVFNYGKILVLIAILILYASLLEYGGFVLSAFLFLFLLFKFSSPGKWAMPIAFSLIAVSISYIVFSKWLSVQLPKGIVGF